MKSGITAGVPYYAISARRVNPTPGGLQRIIWLCGLYSIECNAQVRYPEKEIIDENGPRRGELSGKQVKTTLAFRSSTEVATCLKNTGRIQVMRTKQLATLAPVLPSATKQLTR
ncbi:Hypothetical predicted protein, partial [Cloeon dipterum]